MKNKSIVKFASGIFLIITLLSTIVLNNLSTFAYELPPRIISGESYYIKNKNSGQYLDVYNGEDNNGQNVHQWIMNGTDAQRWQVVHTGGGNWKIVSQLGLKNKVLHVSGGGSVNETNIDIWTDDNSLDKRFRIDVTNDGYSYKIQSSSANGPMVVTVANASCNTGENVFQFQYNGTWNDEWIFEPVFNYSQDLAVNYAKINFNKRVPTYPDCSSLGGDCANFVSQCMLAGGVHYQSYWWIYKKNNTYLKPTDGSQLDYSWDFSDSSPWFKAQEFNEFWSSKVTVETYLGRDILNDPNAVYTAKFYKGDVIQILYKNIWGNPGNAWHTMFITGYGTYNNKSTYILTYHTTDTEEKTLMELAAAFPDDYFRLFTIN